jgi:predicted secreted hydrolase
MKPFALCPGTERGSVRERLLGVIFNIVVLAVAVAAVGAFTESAAAATPQISLPQDEGPHDTSHEWWYFTGHLKGIDSYGRPHSYGFELTVFRQNIAYPDQAVYAGHLAVTDLTRGTFMFEEQIVLQPDTVLPGGGFNISVNDWNISGRNGANDATGAFTQPSYSLSLDLNSSLPAALHGDGGVIPYGPLGESFYYSRTNLKVSGVVTDYGVPVKVIGTAWFDHQWGNFLPNVAGWDWFSVQLINGTQYMVYLIKDGNGQIVQKVGTLVNADGSTQALDPDSLSEVVLGSWTSPASGVTYSSGWQLKVPGGQLTILPQLKDQELRVVVSPAGTYWEGATTVIGAINGRPVIGQGYTELTPPGQF